MKVWELISELSKRPAGQDVWLKNNDDSSIVDVDSVDATTSDSLIIVGNGKTDVQEED